MLTEAEQNFFRSADPAGYILFARNCIEPDQLRRLTETLRSLAGRERLPILIDQEGGRVARLRPPHWPEFPPAARFAALYDKAPITAMEAARFNAQAIAVLLADLGVTVDCLPVADVNDPDGHDIIGDRAYGGDPLVVAALARATLDGLKAGGVVGVVKHIPGHGRAAADSHQELPLVSADRAALERDFAPFRKLAASAPMAMTAHVVYAAIDSRRCASLSGRVIEEVVRRNIGFDGLLMSDDLGMNALSGDFGARAAGVIAAGCDIALHCSGDLAEMEAVARALSPIGALAFARLEQAMRWPRPSDRSLPLAQLVARRDALMQAA